jgi:hypothetical protein
VARNVPSLPTHRRQQPPGIAIARQIRDRSVPRRTVVRVVLVAVLVAASLLGHASGARAADAKQDLLQGTLWANAGGARTIWSGSVPPGATAQAYISGSMDLAASLKSSSSYAFRWECGAAWGSTDSIRAASFAISPGIGVSSTLPPSSAGRQCSYVTEPSTIVDAYPISVSAAVIKLTSTVDASSAPVTSYPPGYQTLPSPTLGPLTMFCYAPVPNGGYGPPTPVVCDPATLPAGSTCYMSDPVDPNVLPQPTTCPTPAPAAGVASCSYTNAYCTPQSFKMTLKPGDRFHFHYSITNSTHVMYCKVGGMQSGYNAPGYLNVYPAGSGPGSAYNDEYCDGSHPGGYLCSADDPTDWPCSGDSGSLVSTETVTPYLSCETFYDPSQGGTCSVAIVVEQFASPVPSLSPTPSPTLCDEACVLEQILLQLQQQQQGQVQATASSGVGVPVQPGILGGPGGAPPVDLGTAAAGCTATTRMGTVGYISVPSSANPFPSINPLDYFVWIGSNVLTAAASAVNVGIWSWNGVVQLLVPSNCMGTVLAQFTTNVSSLAPFSWFAGLTGGITAALSGAGCSFAIPSADIAGVHVAIPLATIGAQVAPYRGLVGAAALFLVAIGMVRLLMGSLGIGKSDGGE